MSEWTVSAKNVALVAKANNYLVILEHQGQGISWLVENRLYIFEDAPNGLSIWAGCVRRTYPRNRCDFEMDDGPESFRKLGPDEFDRLSKELPVIEPWPEDCTEENVPPTATLEERVRILEEKLNRLSLLSLG